MGKRARHLIAAIAITTVARSLWAAESGWPQFLGPDRNGISSETDLMTAWPDAGPGEVWRVQGGAGMSGLVVRGPRVVTMVQRDRKQLVVALDVKDGREVWKREVSREYKNQMGGNGPRATPVIADNSVFAYSGDGTLIALRLQDGTSRWRHEVVKELKGKPADYGMASSPLIVDKFVVVTVGAPNATVVAYERESGKFAWKGGSDRAGYSSPALLEIGGRPQVVAFTGQSAIGLAPDSGALLWRYPFKTNFDCNVVTPIQHDGRVFISSGENHGSAFLEIQPDGMIKEVWTSLGPRSVLRNEWQTSILIDGHLYGFDNVGSAGSISHLNCVKISNGKRVWQKLRYGKGNLIAADGKLFIVTFEGDLVLAHASPKGYEELGRKKVLRSTRQAPALAKGLLYLRDDREIVCLDVRKQ